MPCCVISAVSKGGIYRVAGHCCQVLWQVSITLFALVLDVASALRCGSYKLVSETCICIPAAVFPLMAPVTVTSKSSVWELFVEFNSTMENKYRCPRN